MNMEQPSAELLEKIRLMLPYFEELEVDKRRMFSEQVMLPQDRLGLRDKSLFSLDNVREAIRISSRATSRGFFSRRNMISYQVRYADNVCLEFTDLVHVTGDKESRTLHVVNTYLPGDWLGKLEPAYQKCLYIRSLRERIPNLERELHNTEKAEDILKLVYESTEAEHIVNLLLLGNNYNPNSSILFTAYLTLGRISEAIQLIHDTLRFHRGDPEMHLMLGNLYFSAVCNVKGWAPGLDPGPLKEITLEAMRCFNCRLAAGNAEDLFKNAIKLSKDRRISEQAANALRTLKLMEDL